MKKKDLILIGAILLCSLCLLIIFSKKNPGNMVTIILDGSSIGNYSLLENKEIPIEGKDGYNLVCIQDGYVYMKEADCPDQYCVKTGKIDLHNQTIVCLPHKLIVEVQGSIEGEKQVDAITK